MIMRQEGDMLYAEEGMVLKRKNSDDIYGKEISLGKSYYIDGVLLSEPHIDVPEDFEEIPNPYPEEDSEPFIPYEEIL